MRHFVAFSKKEFRESVATFKLYILIAVFLVLGMMSPLLAKAMPDILNMVVHSDNMQGLSLSIPEPTAMDAWTQFFKNVEQTGMIVLVIVFCGMMANELSKGTLVNLLTKGLSRRAVIAAKFVCASSLWTVSYLVCLTVCYGYTAYFWGVQEWNHPALTFAAPWLFGLLLIALLLFGGTVFGNIFGSLLTCGGAVVGLSIVSIFQNLAKYNPLTLASGTLSLLSGGATPSDFLAAFVVCSTLILILLFASMAVFDKKRL